jgi:hypothetical protein
MSASADKKSDKDVVLTELSKTVTRLENRGCNITGLYYGINDKIRKGSHGKNNDERQNGYESEQDESVPEGHSIWQPESDFVKLYPDALNRISFRLSGAEAMTLMRLVPFIDYESGMLKHDKRPLIMKDIIEMTGYSKVTVIGIMDKLVSERILAKTRVGRTFEFFVNPYIFFKGKYINNTLIDMFKDYGRLK